MNPTRFIVLLAIYSVLLVGIRVPAATASSTPFTLHWTAPGDDGTTGRATSYDLRYSAFPITVTNFLQATRITGMAAPAEAGTQESFAVTGLVNEQSLYWAMKSADEVGHWSGISNTATRPGMSSTDVDPRALTLSFSSPWPNPARQSVRWTYSIPQAVHVRVDVFDITGRHVHTVADGEFAAGQGDLSWDLRDSQGQPAGAGVYFVKARLGSAEWSKRLIVTR